VFSTAACQTSDPAEPPADAWVGTITTDATVTTVVNDSGSVWGSGASLVEEASIGVESGADEYMFGHVMGIAATADRIYVIDRQVPALRVYDHQGQWLHDIGGLGQGPGEYVSLSSIAIASDGRILVRDDDARRIWIYATDGDYVGAYEMSGGLHTSNPMVLSPDDVPFTEVFVALNRDDPNRMFVTAWQAHGEDGPFGEQIIQPIDESFTPGVASNEQGSVQRPVPFYAQEKRALARDLSVLFGVSEAYRFEVRKADGTVLVIERTGDPIAVDPHEADWNKRNTTAIMREVLPDWVWGDTPEVPSHKPAYDELIPTQSGAIWVLRPGPGERLADCDEDAETSEEFAAYPCWRDRRIVDIFGPDGRFLGSLEPPPEMRFSPRPFIDGDLIVAHAQDENATSMVKRYRLVRPEAQ
jgi:hypothetical protein